MKKEVLKKRKKTFFCEILLADIKIFLFHVLPFSVDLLRSVTATSYHLKGINTYLPKIVMYLENNRTQNVQNLAKRTQICITTPVAIKGTTLTSIG